MAVETTTIRLVLLNPVMKSHLYINEREVPFAKVSIYAEVGEQLSATVTLPIGEIILDGEFIKTTNDI